MVSVSAAAVDREKLDSQIGSGISKSKFMSACNGHLFISRINHFADPVNIRDMRASRSQRQEGQP